jgi:hypothetical protein
MAMPDAMESDAPFQATADHRAPYTPGPLLDMQASSNDLSFEQWLLRALSDPILPGVIVIDLGQCFVRTTRSSALLTAEEVRQLKLALQLNSNLKVLKLHDPPSYGEVRSFALGHGSLLDTDKLNEIAEPICKLTALQQLYLGGKICILIFIWAGLRCG